MGHELCNKERHGGNKNRIIRRLGSLLRRSAQRSESWLVLMCCADKAQCAGLESVSFRLCLPSYCCANENSVHRNRSAHDMDFDLSVCFELPVAKLSIKRSTETMPNFVQLSTGKQQRQLPALG